MVVMFLTLLACQQAAPAPDMAVVDELVVLARTQPEVIAARIEQLDEPLLRTAVILELIVDPEVFFTEQQATTICGLAPAKHTRKQCMNRYRRDHLNQILKYKLQRQRGQGQGGGHGGGHGGGKGKAPTGRP